MTRTGWPTSPAWNFHALDPDRAIAACSAAASSYPNERRIAFQLGRAFYAAKRYDEARRVLEKAVEAGSTSGANSLGLSISTGWACRKRMRSKQQPVRPAPQGPATCAP